MLYENVRSDADHASERHGLLAEHLVLLTKSLGLLAELSRDIFGFGATFDLGAGPESFINISGISRLSCPYYL